MRGTIPISIAHGQPSGLILLLCSVLETVLNMHSRMAF